MSNDVTATTDDITVMSIVPKFGKNLSTVMSFLPTLGTILVAVGSFVPNFK